MIMCTICCIAISINFYICKQRASCNRFSYSCTCNGYPEELPRVPALGFYTNLVSCDVHSSTQYIPKCNCACRKQHSKQEYSVTSRMHACFVHKNAQRHFHY